MTSHRNVKLVTWFNFFNDFRPYSAIAILYFAQITGSFALGMTVFAIDHISSAIFEVPTGIWSDNVGRKKTVIYGALASALSIFFYAIGGSFWMLAVGAVFTGLSQSLFSGNNNALLYDSLKEDNRENSFAEVLGKTSSMFQIGLGVSALIGGLVANWSLSYVFWISVIPQVISIFIAVKIIEPKIHYEKISGNIYNQLKQALATFKENYRLRTLSIAGVIDYAVGETMYQFNPAFIASVWPTWAIGIGKALSNVFGFFSFRFAGKVLKKYNPLKTLLTSQTISNVVSIIAVAKPTVISPALMSLTSLEFGLGTTARGTLLHQEFTDQQRATLSSLNALAGSIVFAIFAYLFGLFADSLGPAKSMLIGQVILLSVPFLYWRVFKHSKRTN
jgi:MFS family permease